MPRDREIVERELGHRAANGIPKRSYDTKAAAKKARKHAGVKRADELKAYECVVCHGWHLGKNEPGVGRDKLPTRPGNPWW